MRENWWRYGDSNPRPSHCERDALPAELYPQKVDFSISLAKCFFAIPTTPDYALVQVGSKDLVLQCSNVRSSFIIRSIEVSAANFERECDMNWRNLAVLSPCFGAECHHTCRAIALQTLRRDHNNSINGRSKMLMSTMLASTR